MGSAIVAAALLVMPLGVAAPASADSSSQWPLQYLKANQDWAISKGAGVTVAVLDSGVAQIPDTQGSLLSGADFSGGTTSSGNGQEDLHGHGTEMAVMIAGAGSPSHGLAPGSKILPVRITSGETDGQVDEMAAGIEFAISHHASVINISQRLTSTDDTLIKAVRDADAAGAVIVASSGNESQSIVDIPASIPGVVAIGATDHNGTIWPQSNTGSRVTLSAPGVNVQSDDNSGGVSVSDGTSDATAYVSATVALIRSAHPSWTAGQVIRDLIATADPGPGQSAGAHSDQYGYGIVDPLKALQASAPTDTSNPLLGSASAAPTGGANSGVSPTDTAASTPGGNSTPKSSGNALVGGIIVLVVLAGAVLLIVWLVRRNRNRRGPGAPGGQPPYQGGGPGGPGYGYGVPPQQQQGSYQPPQYAQPPYSQPPSIQPPYPQPPAQYPAPQQYPTPPAPAPAQYPVQPPPQQQQPPEQQQNPYGYR
ncbi:S8 family serine peptidase [Actinospica robiniae]|uniref:S8 family serine peptidase n=1 Tax=Actinospica robiniae TaxID=304901 RepID=UPI0003F4E486|nr:S8 family serine peptidase [Actinospica robiniae]